MGFADNSGVMGRRIAVIVAALVAYGIFVWWMAAPLNIHSPWFWVVLAVFDWLVLASCCLLLGGDYPEDFARSSETGDLKQWFVWTAAAPLVAMFIGWMVSTPLFATEAYASRLAPQNATFEEWSDRLTMDGISLMDTESATIAGNRELGGLGNVASQFSDSDYWQIVTDDGPRKVSGLQYASFLKWLNDRGGGTPGYVSVDPVRQDAQYHALDEGDGMRYIPGAYMNDKLSRHLWRQYPTAVFGVSHLELDDDGNPFYVTPSYSFGAGLFGAKDVSQVAVTDPVSGETGMYDVRDVPEWVDVVYDGDLLDDMYDSYGSLSGGFLNSIFGQSGCTRTGGDYGYVAIDGEQWIYTGVTSMGDDASNVGFLLASERTKESYFIPMSSADEESAMKSAEGEVQQYGYTASFPSLVAVDGTPTYVMVLKDDSGIVKMYAMVNAESYNVVACGDTLSSVKSDYEDALDRAGVERTADGQEMPSVSADGKDEGGGKAAVGFDTTVDMVMMADSGGDTYAYVLGKDGVTYRAKFSEFPSRLMSLSEGDAWKGTASEAKDVSEVVTLD